MNHSKGFPDSAVVKNPPGDTRDVFDLWVGQILWSRKCQSTPVVLPGESNGQRSPAGYSPWGSKEWDMTE